LKETTDELALGFGAPLGDKNTKLKWTDNSTGDADKKQLEDLPEDGSMLKKEQQQKSILKVRDKGYMLKKEQQQKSILKVRDLCLTRSSSRSRL
jgi:hypothetical protein